MPGRAVVRGLEQPKRILSALRLVRGRHQRLARHPTNVGTARSTRQAYPIDYVVSDSGGHREERYVIETPLRLGDTEFAAEVTLTNRDTMLFRMLLGRTAMHGRFLVDPARSFLMGKQGHRRP